MLYNNGQLGYYSGDVEVDKARVQVLLQMNRELNKRKIELMQEVSAELGRPFEMPLLPETEGEWVTDFGTSCAVEDQAYLDSLEPVNQHLLAAYDAHDAGAMKRALEKGADPDLRLTWEGDTLAADAVLSGWPEAAELLLDAGADPMAEEGRLLIQLCCMGEAELLRRVLQMPGVSPDFSDGYDSLAVWAAEMGQVECLRELRAAGADLLANDGKALCMACAANKVESARYLLEECGSDTELEYDDWTPLDHAAAHDSMECAKLLLEAGANPEHEDICGRTPMQRADSERMRQLLDHYCVNSRRR